MLDRILDYLSQQDAAVPADRILRDALGIHSPNRATADRVLRGIVGKDGRFSGRQGLWKATLLGLQRPAGRPAAAACLHIETAGRSAAGQPARGALDCGAGKPPHLFDTASGPGIEGLRRARQAAEGQVLAAWTRTELGLWKRLVRQHRLPAWTGPTLSLQALTLRVLPGVPRRVAPGDIAARLGFSTPDPDHLGAMARYLSSVLGSLLESVPAEMRADPGAVACWLEKSQPRVDFSRFSFGPEFLDGLPPQPGVYIMRNRAGHIIYVGKSDNLRRRVRSYFTPRGLRDPKVARIHEHLHGIEICPTLSEIDALIMEMRLIRDFRPPVNLQSEVHESPAAYGRLPNLIIIVPSGDWAFLYLVRDGTFRSRLRTRLGRPPGTNARTRIRSVYYENRTRGRAKTGLETELVSRWIASRRRKVNYVDVDEAADLEDTLRRLRDYLTDPDRLTAKVLYR